MEENQANRGRQGQSPEKNQYRQEDLNQDNNISKEDVEKVSNQFLGQEYADTSVEGSVMSSDNEEDIGAPQLATSSDSLTGDNSGDIGSGLSTGGDAASMTGQNIDDLGLPNAEDIAQSRADEDAIVDTGQQNNLDQSSGQATTGKATADGGYELYPNSGDLGQVDPGQQNYAEDQDRRQAFTAGDYKTSQEKDTEEGSEKYGDPANNNTPKVPHKEQQRSHAENVGGTSQDDVN